MRATRRTTLVVLTAACITLALVAGTVSRTANSATSASTCSLSNGIKHVVYLQFDNTHFRRDNPNVPSDLEQMPHLLDFLKGNGTLFTNDHTILISHTAGGILSSLTGLYPDRNGMTVSNTYDFFHPDGTTDFHGSSFQYWTAPVASSFDTKPNMITDGGKNTPAPWASYTKAGCDVGGVGTANIELENNSTDVTQVYGTGSPEASESSAQKTTDFVGIAIHCAQAASSKCAGNAHARDDVLPDEPGGYSGFKALFGAKYVNPAITGGDACVKATDGSDIQGASGTGCGFPGFDGGLAKNSLGYVEQMQESGVPVTFAYISDAHDSHTGAGAFGPGEAAYKQQLADYDSAFATFFQNLASHGIDKSNTLFMVTVDEGDHFAGAQVTPDATGTATYSHITCPQGTTAAPVVNECQPNMVGEVNVKIGGVLPASEPAYDIHFDDAPTFYVNGQPSRTDPAVRKLEQDVASANAPDPYANGDAGANVPIAQYLADPVEEQALHMINADPQRTPTFTMFGNPDFYFQTSNLSGGCSGSVVCVNPGFAWNHGDAQNEIGNTWVGIVGPGVAHDGVDSKTFTDHTNLRPTIDALTGLHDSYTLDGRVLIEALTAKATPKSLVAHHESVRQLGAVYEQLNAPF
ncbi:MAG TPA: hypothetical protein VGU02_05360, partial [Gaiellaceae bacterium]|nr:hypothetical protein [Gaiellaceae bacterium]